MTEENKEESTEVMLGSIIEVEVSNVTDFGAFVICKNGEQGLVHISEIANEFVTNINKFVKVGDIIAVKVLSRKKGKLELSIKKAEQAPPKKALFLKSTTNNKEFEDILTKYLKRSEERQIDIRRNLKKKHGIAKKNK